MARTGAHALDGIDELADYGDLSSFTSRSRPQLSNRDEQDAIDLIMGGESFSAGDGTLDHRGSDQNREPPRDVAREAVADAISRLESLADGVASSRAPEIRSGAIESLSPFDFPEVDRPSPPPVPRPRITAHAASERIAPEAEVAAPLPDSPPPEPQVVPRTSKRSGIAHYIAQYRLMVFAVIVAVVAMAVSYFMKPVAVPTSAASTTPTQPVDLQSPVPLPIPAPTSPDVRWATQAPRESDTELQTRLSELSERLAAIEHERDQLRSENQSLKAKPALAKPKPTRTARKATPVASSPVVEREPAPNILYLGSFSDGDRLVAEVLIDGSLTRVTRGDVVSGNRRVTEVGEMSVTIDDVVYSP